MKPSTLIVALVLVVSDIFIWHAVVFGAPQNAYELDFLDVGQGDAELVQLPGGVKILTDAGPDASVARALERALPSGDRYIDIGIVTHTQKDHFGGYDALVGKYQFGAILFNGITDSEGVPSEWKLLREKIARERIPLIAVAAGDAVTHASSALRIISPSSEFIQSAELNDTGIVSRLETPSFRALFVADIGFTVEGFLWKKFDLTADILKIGHHGSKTSSGAEFLRAVSPKVAVVEAGVKNNYGHPAPATLARIASSTGAAIFRTDKDGTVRIVVRNSLLEVFKEKK
ncbi:MAG: hypothetical protein A2946_03380 [Candidatus Liptonbacteria bacterium RIFCSPLOWO2_01_FULL_53_13]|uniref:Metallo-beta-lactamase domain-containing protein n=1 Tax=Candidatus Liptonbacteria bacterium RIFCSPLOWO2_01_FULL_53_13 TaxID=1798651 RepID=A0A1G2CHP9_9BACT|nr:MAG: hypothetical protein A2946_03380 [Candidatus Liptonbacteria bacterium RIFCSPLOWO2_01_FULL_53_13]